MMKSIILGLFAIFAMNFVLKESKVEVSDVVLENAEALEIQSVPVACSSCVGPRIPGCTVVEEVGGEIIVWGCYGIKVEEE